MGFGFPPFAKANSCQPTERLVRGSFIDCRAIAAVTRKRATLVGRVGLEPTTSPLSGVRSNHLSYQPVSDASPKPHGLCRPVRGRYAEGIRRWRHKFLEMLCQSRSSGRLIVVIVEACPGSGPAPCQQSTLRKEVIQPQVPLRLPCYDFTPVADPTVAGRVPKVR